MFRGRSLVSVMVACAALGGIGIGVVHADALSTIEARIKLMKVDGEQARLGLDMTRGTVPFDLAKAKGIFSTFIDAAEKEKTLFPPDSKTGGGTTASPRIWQDMDGFLKAYDKFGKDSADGLASTKDLASFKAAFGVVAKDCGGCHEAWRVKKG